MILDHFGGHFGLIRDAFGTVLGWFLGYSGIGLGVVLGLFRHRFGIMQRPFWCVFEAFGRFFGSFLGHLVGGGCVKNCVEILTYFEEDT